MIQKHFNDMLRLYIGGDRMEITINDNKLALMVGDITKQETDAIVNAANGSLLGGGGVDGAIHRAAGPELLQTCKKVRQELLRDNYLPTGEAVMTKGFNLPASYVIHTVGPIWEEAGNEEELLANCYENSLMLALTLKGDGANVVDKNGGLLSTEMPKSDSSGSKQLSIAFPSISTGVYRFPIDLAAETALKTISDFLSKYTFGKVVMTLFSEDDYHVYENALKKL